MPTKKPRRTSDRILDVTLAMFNRFGEPNVSTSQLCGELGISPGNLFYHHPTRNALVHGLFGRYQLALVNTLADQASAANAPPLPSWWPLASPALQQLARQCEGIARVSWTYRFLFRDLSDLVSRHRVLEEHLPVLLQQQAQALLTHLKALNWRDGVDTATLVAWVGPMLATLTGSLGLDGALDPRERLRESEAQVCLRAVNRAMSLVCFALTGPDQPLLADHLSRGDQLGPDPWWLGLADG